MQVPSAGGSAKHITKGKAGVARRGLKEVGGKPLIRRTETASGIRRRVSLLVPTVIDRLVQQAVLQVLNLYYDTTFSTSSYGFRPFRDCKDAVLHCIRQTDVGKVWAVDVDLEKFFDTENHSRLIRKLSTRIKDPRVISLIHRMLKSGIDIGPFLSELTMEVFLLWSAGVVMMATAAKRLYRPAFDRAKKRFLKIQDESRSAESR